MLHYLSIFDAEAVSVEVRSSSVNYCWGTLAEMGSNGKRVIRAA
ncbi:hypothetical protein DSM109990_02698 [Sulfitobacter dubius]|uniref:Transposase n=1 Tax=Sulfitobacter dubius TaxID=218673 RepID=A0ABY3ZQ11_9RHOB|nr:hypothetical protein DSM109990_02698 [Sulfitobacter dubius]